MASSGPSTVIKLGGSLLSLPNLVPRIGAVVRRMAGARPLIVSGGGDAADLVRAWQPVHGLTDEQAHWLALRAVSLNEALLMRLIPASVIVQSRDQMMAAWNDRRLPILASETFLAAEEPQAHLRMSHDWSVTSDAIAAWVAHQLGCRRLALLKSCELPPGINLQAASEQGLVDGSFPRFAAMLSIFWINLRADELRVTKWQAPLRGPSA